MGRIDGITRGAPCNRANLDHFLSAATPVATPDGAVPISAIEVGDLVLAYHEATGATGVYTVTDTIAPVDPLVVVLTLDADDLETTLDHPFFTRTQGWVAARQLTPGAQVRRLDGSYGAVTRVVLAVRVQPMYNLTVATAHTFFVGDDGWLVHNCGGGVQLRPKNGNKLSQQIKRWREKTGAQGGANEFLEYASNLATEAQKAGTYVTGEVGKGANALGEATIYRRGNEFIVEQDGKIMSYVADAKEGGIMDAYIRLGGT